MTARTLPKPGPVLTLAERDRRWNGLRAFMRDRAIDTIVVGSFNGRERLESYLIDDFLDSVVVLPRDRDAIVLTFSASRLSRAFESERRGIPLWARDYRLAGGGASTGAAIREVTPAGGRVGVVGFGPTAPGEMEGLLPYGFHRHLTEALGTIELVDFTQAFTDFMLVKSDEELALLKFAAHVSEQASLAMIEACVPGENEAAVYAAIMSEIYRWGCETRYPNMSLQSGRDNIGWGAPRWALRAEPPRTLQAGDVVQAEIHTVYGGQEAQVQMSVALDPIDDVLSTCADVARRAYEAGVAAVRPGVTFASVVHAMEAPLRAAGAWSKTPLVHTLTFGATGFTPINREQLAGTREERTEGRITAGIRRGDLVLLPGMTLELEPNACVGMQRVNIGGVVLVTATGAEEYNDVPTRMRRR
ncbi:MAG: M24 family metallopeptidase [Candidatus Lustribacter sp.]|jgi:Xaa-Pro aminopeptidase